LVVADAFFDGAPQGVFLQQFGDLRAVCEVLAADRYAQYRMRATLRRVARKLWPFGRRPARCEDDWLDDDGDAALVPVGPPRRPRPSGAVALELPGEAIVTEARADEHARGFLRRLLGR
jgi:hypothetical protein